MRRRVFLQAVGATTFGVMTPSTATAQTSTTSFVSEFGQGVAHYFDADWTQEDFEEVLEEALDIICFARGTIEETSEEIQDSIEKRSGFLAGLVKEVNTDPSNPAVWRWVSRNIEEIAALLDAADFFEDTADLLEDATSRVDDLSNYLPVAHSLHGLLETGCYIHSRLEDEEPVKQSAYVRFFKYVGMTIANIVLLYIGAQIPYRVAYGATGYVNRALIQFGHKIGWRAYSWVLSQVHWGIRIVVADEFGYAISNTVRIVTEDVYNNLVDQTRVTRETVRNHVESDVKKIAESNHMVEYWLWRADRLLESIESLF